jgi:hypothetical protein
VRRIARPYLFQLPAIVTNKPSKIYYCRNRLVRISRIAAPQAPNPHQHSSLLSSPSLINNAVTTPLWTTSIVESSSYRPFYIRNGLSRGSPALPSSHRRSFLLCRQADAGGCTRHQSRTLWAHWQWISAQRRVEGP